MNAYRVLMIAHAWVGALLFLLVISSIATAVHIAVKPDDDRANARLLNRANTIGLIENVVAVLLTLTGVTVMLMGNWPLSQAWLWMSLAIMLFYSTTVFAITKRPRMALAEGGTAVKAGMQVLLHVTYLLLLLVGLVLMWVKPL
jgi:uncharacterized membrane protein